ncbi:hypothetical protein [Micromonospora peucetia]|uniref:Uncharacterized protein n=1 Tax=Micromonospora peucetia TaxID=47871 RepID=A0A1C6TUW9_9ACTN|nr:hypothetical protein [Micromonospora peucetia]SCL45575.1 hypothetical protein GA0070608_0027 [Micromonospora peucetia]
MSVVSPVPPGRPRAARPPRAVINDRLLSACDGPEGSTLLHEEVRQNLEHLWQYGGNRDGRTPGRRPDWIFIRQDFLLQQPGTDHAPGLARLVPARGLPLRLELLMLFDAQCRYGLGERVRVDRTFEDMEASAPIKSWQKVVLSDTSSDYREAGALRGRQIKEALRVLDKQHLVDIGPDKSRPGRRDLNRITLLSEASTPVSRPKYTVPEGGVYVSRHFFTSLWVFALTNTEIAVFLALSARRAAFPLAHTGGGVFVVQEHRRQFGLKDNTWRSARELHTYGLVDRVHDTERDTQTGRITDYGNRWKKHEVMPTRFTIIDSALEQPAVPTIDRVLNNPTPEDQWRQWFG